MYNIDKGRCNNMKVTTAIKSIMKAKGITQGKMAGFLDDKFKDDPKAGQSYVSTKFRNDNWTVDSVIEFLGQMDYELVIKPKSRGKRKEDEVLIEHSKKVQK